MFNRGKGLTRFHSMWDHIIGPDAAELRYRAYVARLRFFQSLVVATVFILISGATTRTHWAHTTFAVLAYLTIGIGGIWIGVWTKRRPRQYGPASAFLKVQVDGRNFPPLGQQAFERWCEHRGIKPPLPTADPDPHASG